MSKGQAKYARAYNLLNFEQRRAVDQLDGPVLVIAGPGTGKTQLLSVRVANILQKTDTDPANVLCLTFTNKAAVNMRDRLLDLGGGALRDVFVRTFHSFAGEIMNLHPDYFWSGGRLSLAPDTLQLEIVGKILAGLPLNNPLALKFAGRYTLVDDVANALRLAKEAGLTPAKLKAVAEANLTYLDKIEGKLVDILAPPLSVKRLSKLKNAVHDLPDQEMRRYSAPLIPLSTVLKESLDLALAKDADEGKTKHAGAWKARWVQSVEGRKAMYAERGRNNWWLAVADVYQQYREQLHSRGYYDYADMLVEVITKLEQNPDLLADIQERFLYVLIDEFQDTNAAQLRLAHLVADHASANGRPNLMVVGDDDQSIFKFNGAELNNMLSFTRSYPDTKLIVLKDNYRSTQAVLDTGGQIIAQARDRLVYRDSRITKDIKAVRPPVKNGVIEHVIYPTREHQYSHLAQRIKKIKRGAGSIAILARGHDSLHKMAGVLISLGVPVRYERQSNILEHPAIRQTAVIAKLAIAIGEGNKSLVNQLLGQTLRHPMWGLDKTKLWRLALANYSNPNWLDSLLAHPDKQFKSIGQWLLWLSGDGVAQPLPLVLEYILGLRATKSFGSPLRGYFINIKSGDTDYLQAISGVQLLRALADELSSDTQSSLQDFVRLIDVNVSGNKIITDESPFVTNPNAVELLSVHKAKGLEFDHVFIIDAIEDNWRPRPGRRKPPANLPLQPHGDDEDDYARLMYVAATRARHSVVFTSYGADHAGKELLASPLVRGAVKKPLILSPASTGNPIEILEENLRWPRLSGHSEKQILKARLDNYSLSVTGLINFLDVTSGGPAYFLERNLLRLPEAKTPSLAFGTAMHSALEQAQLLVNKDEFKLKLILEGFSKSLAREHLPPAEFQRYLLHGEGVLKRLFKELSYQPPKGSLTEQLVRDIRIGRAILGGKLDRLDGLGSPELVIVDYKTGKPLDSLTGNNKSTAIKAWKHRTQLVFYALLARNSPRFKRSTHIRGQMVYLEAESRRTLLRDYVPTQVEIDRLDALVNAVWPLIVNLDLPDVTKYSKDYAGILQFENDLLKIS